MEFLIPSRGFLSLSPATTKLGFSKEEKKIDGAFVTNVKICFRLSSRLRLWKFIDNLSTPTLLVTQLTQPPRKCAPDFLMICRTPILEAYKRGKFYTRENFFLRSASI